MGRNKAHRAKTVEEYSEELTVTIGGEEGTLSVTLNLQQYKGYKACQRFDLDLFLDMPGEDTEEIGYSIGWVVDKAMQPAKGKKVWIMELLEEDEQGANDETAELRRTIRELFKKSGEPKAKVELLEQELKLDHMVFIDTLLLEADYRGKGVAQKVVESFHRLVREMIGPEASEEQTLATIILSPAKSGDVDLENEKTEVEIERGLIKAYEKVDYVVWIKGKEDREDTMTVMGRTL